MSVLMRSLSEGQFVATMSAPGKVELAQVVSTTPHKLNGVLNMGLCIVKTGEFVDQPVVTTDRGFAVLSTNDDPELVDYMVSHQGV